MQASPPHSGGRVQLTCLGTIPLWIDRSTSVSSCDRNSVNIEQNAPKHPLHSGGSLPLQTIFKSFNVPLVPAQRHDDVGRTLFDHMSGNYCDLQPLQAAV
eukprot:gb/GECG01003983.1/.p1 GENE.gb/GECG01003983.1/~~gb/GECG01003983.1/.p1  ORF type:complete len:100 (+),score=3.76 gb/GECG01003983.1/:1-300(+)